MAAVPPLTGNPDRPSMAKTALITGATSGMGSDFARQLVDRGFEVIVTGRDEQRLAQIELETGAVLAVQADLAEHDGVSYLMNQIADAGLTVDVLINNAGFTVYGAFAEASAEAQLGLVRVNVLALTELTRSVLPAMIERGDGRILNVASSAAYLPGPFMTTYYASKAYVLSFSEGLAEALAGSGVTVTALTPGPVKTQFQSRGKMGSARLFSAAYVPVSEPATVSAAGIDGMLEGRRVVAPGLGIRAIILTTRLLPRRLLGRAARWMHEQR